MINEFTTKDMSDLLYEDLSQIKDDEKNKTKTILQMPTTKSKFPCRLINTPLESTIKTENAIPILKNFQVIIEHWSETQRKCMDMASDTDKVLQKRNLVKINTNQIIYDEITKQYRLITTYEVKWEGLTNSFKNIK